MKIGETNEIGQAVFGYSNGHRLLTSTASLSAVDVYELAAASDLAPGVRISGDASYLTGLPLPDSKSYALIRTWLAPEMPRPGCVWSHVLLLDHALMSTQFDLAVLKVLHRRPHSFSTDKSFSTTIAVDRRLRAERADAKAVEQVLLACYADQALHHAEDQHELEHAILAVWSQQWPRLRRRFVFRSSASTAVLKGQSFDFDGGPPSPGRTTNLSWLPDAVLDATSQKVTSLRRFLWRYGKDVHSDRFVLPYLVQLHRSTRTERLEPHLAHEVLSRFPPGQAETLKKDMLGLSSSRSSLVPKVGDVDLIELLAKYDVEELGYDSAEISSIFSQADGDLLLDLVQALMSLRHELGDAFALVLSAVLPNVEAWMIEREDSSGEFAAMAAMERPELLTGPVMNRFDNEQLLRFATSDRHADGRSAMVMTAMTRPFDGLFAGLALDDPGRTLSDALALDKVSRLHDGWKGFLREHSSVFVEAMGKPDGNNLMATAQLLGFPRDPRSMVSIWSEAFVHYRRMLTRDDDASLSVYLLDLVIRHGMSEFEGVLTEIVAPLRNRALHNDLPPGASEWLSSILPADGAVWDLNKRLLKLFRRAYQSGRRFDAVLETLHLSDVEYAYATHQDPKNMARRMMEAFHPWFGSS